MFFGLGYRNVWQEKIFHVKILYRYMKKIRNRHIEFEINRTDLACLNQRMKRLCTCIYRMTFL